MPDRRKTGLSLTRLMMIGGLCAATLTGGDVLAQVERGVQNGIAFENGGVSEEARVAINGSAPAFPLVLVFALSAGDYLSDVRVRVSNGGGKPVFSLSDSGPIVLIGLPQGAYTVTVDRGGSEQSRRVTIGARTHQKTVFYWAKD